MPLSRPDGNYATGFVRVTDQSRDLQLAAVVPCSMNRAIPPAVPARRSATCLRGAYGSLILQSDDLADFADDLARVHAAAQPQEKKPLAALIELAGQGAEEPGIELHLDGD
jgi:hypothetical protein